MGVTEGLATRPVWVQEVLAESHARRVLSYVVHDACESSLAPSPLTIQLYALSVWHQDLQLPLALLLYAARFAASGNYV